MVELYDPFDEILGTTAKLNAGQEAAAEGVFEFLLSDEEEMIISGPGGVGKTFLLGFLADRIVPRYREACKLVGIKQQYFDIIFTSTTNKAADVLSQACKRQVNTTASFLHLRVREDYDTGVTQLSKTPKWEVHENLIIIVEECSMVDAALYAYLREGTHNCKIIYVGDHCQLAPVREKLSPIYNKQLRTYELTEPVRNAGQPALLDLCTQLRYTVENGIFYDIEEVPGVIDMFNEQEMEAWISENCIEQSNSQRILAYTNKRVMNYNDHIREVRKLPPEYTVGEMLVNASVFSYGKKNLSVEAEVEIKKISEDTSFIDIDRESRVEIRRADVYSTWAGMLYDVPLAVDRNYVNELAKYFWRERMYSLYFKCKNTFMDLRPLDACTFHKSQGSTYDTVVIDAYNLGTCRDAEMAARMLYVGVSRARNRVIFFGQLPEKFGTLYRATSRQIQTN